MQLISYSFKGSFLSCPGFLSTFNCKILILKNYVLSCIPKSIAKKKAGGGKQAEKKKLEGLLKKFCIVSLRLLCLPRLLIEYS